MSMFCYYKQFLMAKATTRFFMIAHLACADLAISDLSTFQV